MFKVGDRVTILMEADTKYKGKECIITKVLQDDSYEYEVTVFQSPGCKVALEYEVDGFELQLSEGPW